MRPAGRMWSSQSFCAARHMIWELANARMIESLASEKN